MSLTYEEHKILINTLLLIKNTLYSISQVFIEYALRASYADKRMDNVKIITTELDYLIDHFLEIPSSLVRHVAFNKKNFKDDIYLGYCHCSDRDFDYSVVHADLITDYTFLRKAIGLCCKLLPESYYKKFNTMITSIENIKKYTIDFMNQDIKILSDMCIIVDKLNKNIKKDDDQFLFPIKAKDTLSVISNYKVLDDHVSCEYLAETLKIIENASSLLDLKYPIKTKLTDNKAEAKKAAQNILNNYADFWKKNTVHIVKTCVDGCIKMFKNKKEIINLKDDYVKELFFLHTVKECLKLYKVMVVSCLDTINIYKIMHELSNSSNHYIFNDSDVKVTFNNKKHLTSYIHLDVGVLMNKEFVFKGSVSFGIHKPKAYKEISMEIRKRGLLESIK